jgi:hypothetical protein
MNWDAFAQQVAGGIQRGASGWAGSIRSDVEREKNMQDRLKIMKAEQDYQDKKQREDQSWDITRMTLGAGIAQITAKKNAEMEQTIRRNDADYKARIDALMGDRQLGQQWAAKNLMGRGTEAKEEYDLLNRIRNGDVARGPRDSVIMARFTPVAKGALQELLQKNQDRLLDMKQKNALIEYYGANQKLLEGKEEWTLSKAMTAYEDSLMKRGQYQKNIDAITTDLGYQSTMREVARRKFTSEAEFAQKDPALYAQAMSYRNQINDWQELIAPLEQLSEAYRLKVESLKNIGPQPPAPTDADKKALAEKEAFAKERQGAPRQSKPQPARQESFWESARPAVAGQHVTRFLGDLATQAAHGLARAGGFEHIPTPEEVASEYNLKSTDLDRLYISKTPEDWRKVTSGELSLNEGQLIYDALGDDMVMVSIGVDGTPRFIEVRKKGKKK